VSLPRPAITKGLRGRTAARRGLVLVGAGAVALLLALLLVRSDDGSADGGSASTSASAVVAPRVEFPATIGTPAESVARVLPVAVRNVAIDFVAPVEGVMDLPACDAADGGTADTVVWFGGTAADTSGTSETSGVEPVGVAPGEAGTALLRIRASDRDPEPFGAMSVGHVVEVARRNGTALRWDVVAIVDAPAGAAFPTDLLAPSEEPRLVLLACGAATDRFVLTVLDR
jgi:hypothetical protein